MTRRGLEFKFNLSVWIITVSYSLYSVYCFTNRVDEFFTNRGDDFEQGWSVLGRLKDVSDFEWNSWKKLLFYLFPWLYVNSIIAQFIRKYKLFSVSKWYTVISFALVTYRFTIFGLSILVAQPLIYYYVLNNGGKTKVIWLTSICLMVAINIIKRMYENDEIIYTADLESDNIYLILICASWVNLRCISFSLEFISQAKKKLNMKAMKSSPDIWEMFGYIFYAPVLFLGPVILYNDYEASTKSEDNEDFLEKLKYFIYNFCRYLGWLLFIELCAHFIYVEAFVYHTQIIVLMPTWALYGTGLWMGLYFYLKYLVVYGMAGSWAAFDNIEPHIPPRCVARVHRYSQMWKYFDVGLHKFLLKYIYRPVVDGINKENIVYLSFMRAIGSLLCFAFVYCWHGAHDFILIWTILNYFGIVVESISKTISQRVGYRDFKRKVLKTPIMIERFEAVLATPLLIMSALSNFYFFGGYDVGNVFYERLCGQSANATLLLFMCMYCSCRAAQCLDKVHARKIETCKNAA